MWRVHVGNKQGHDGLLRAWQQHQGSWRGSVVHSLGIGRQRVDWIDHDKMVHVTKNRHPIETRAG